MARRFPDLPALTLAALSALCFIIVVLLSTSTAAAQEDPPGENEAPVEAASYGDSELIDALRLSGLIDEWVAASPVSPQASLLRVRGGGSYQAQRQVFLDSIQAWADRTEIVRTELARIDATQANSDGLRSLINQVREALVLDDRLASDSDTLVEIEDALRQLAALQIPQNLEVDAAELELPLILAELRLDELRSQAEAEITALNGVEPAFASTGTSAFVGFDDLQVGLDEVDQLIKRGRDQIRPAREQSERLLSSTVAQIPRLHGARMLGSTDVAGLSVVTVDAYIRAAARVSCSVDWALLAGIGQIESNHGRLGGASVSRSGQVSTTILGPLLDGGETERDTGRETGRETEPDTRGQRAGQAKVVPASLWSLLRGTGVDPTLQDQGNGFEVVVDTDDGRLDGNTEWDRAVGPMQFIPETWSKWATDGNGDRVSDPNNMYDATASAARFLCHLSATRGSSPSTFILGYNASTSYVRSVISTAERLRATSLPAGQ